VKFAFGPLGVSQALRWDAGRAIVRRAPPPAGARLEVVNDGTTGHDLLIGELGKGTPDLPPGESTVLDLSDQPPGTYRVVCDLPGHTEAGMVTELTLE